MRSRTIDVAYEVVCESDDEPLPETDNGDIDHEALGFTAAPTGIDVEVTVMSDNSNGSSGSETPRVGWGTPTRGQIVAQTQPRRLEG